MSKQGPLASTEFLHNSTDGAQFESAIVFADNTNTSITASRITFAMNGKVLTDSNYAVETMNGLRDVVSPYSSVSPIVYAYVFNFWEGYTVIKEETLRNVFLAAAGCAAPRWCTHLEEGRAVGTSGRHQPLADLEPPLRRESDFQIPSSQIRIRGLKSTRIRRIRIESGRIRNPQGSGGGHQMMEVDNGLLLHHVKSSVGTGEVGRGGSGAHHGMARGVVLHRDFGDDGTSLPLHNTPSLSSSSLGLTPQGSLPAGTRRSLRPCR